MLKFLKIWCARKLNIARAKPKVGLIPNKIDATSHIKAKQKIPGTNNIYLISSALHTQQV